MTDARGDAEMLPFRIEPPQADLDDLHGGRAESRELAQNHIVRGGGWIEGTDEAGFGRGPGSLPTLAPDPTWWHLNQRNKEGNGVGEGQSVAIRPPLCQQLAQL